MIFSYVWRVIRVPLVSVSLGGSTPSLIH